MLHVLLHMERLDGPTTSEKIGLMIGTNPGVVRRTMAGLREAGLVVAEKGHGGGWRLCKPLDEITLWAVYSALGEPRLFALGPSNFSTGCALERAANSALESGLSAARLAFMNQLQEVTLADLIEGATGRRHSAGSTNHDRVLA